MAKVLLVDVDSVWPNLALMKISTYHKQQGDEVYLQKLKRLYRDKQLGSYNIEKRAPQLTYDEEYISCIFRRNRDKVITMAKMHQTQGVYVQIGGVGIDLLNKIPPAIESCKPDYTLYNISYGMGFLTRGCIRHCPWCVVPQKEGNIQLATPLKDIMNPHSSNIMIFDNNLLSYPAHKEILIEMLGRHLKVCNTQAFDIRLIDNQNANIIAKIQFTDNEFKHPRIYFSWDLLDIEYKVYEGIEILRRHRIPPSRLFFYNLCGFHVTPEEYNWTYFMQNDWYRYEKLTVLGCLPFIMKYNNRNDIPLLNAFARWVNFEHKAKKKILGRLGSFKSYLQHEYPNIKQT